MALTLRSLPIEVPMRRRAFLKVSPAVFLEICQTTMRPHYYTVAENPLPADAALVGIQFDGQWITLCLESANFEQVPEEQPYPELPSPVFWEVVIEEEEG